MKIKREKSTSTKGHYVRNADLLPAVIEAKKLGKVTDKLIQMIWMIAERYSHKHNFVGYSFREDMVASAVMNLCNTALKFNPEKSQNPFSYYTTSIHNSFLQYMADEKKHRNIRDALLIDAGANPSFNYAKSELEEGSKVMLSDDRNITNENHLEDVTTAPPTAPSTNQPEVEITARCNPSFTRQSFSSLDPGKPGKKRLSNFRDLNPGEVIQYKPGDWEVDEETGEIRIIRKETPEKKTEKKTVKKTVRKTSKGK